MTPNEIKYYSRANIFSPFYQVLGFKIRKGAFFWDTLYKNILLGGQRERERTGIAEGAK